MVGGVSSAGGGNYVPQIPSSPGPKATPDNATGTGGQDGGGVGNDHADPAANAKRVPRNGIHSTANLLKNRNQLNGNGSANPRGKAADPKGGDGDGPEVQHINIPAKGDETKAPDSDDPLHVQLKDIEDSEATREYKMKMMDKLGDIARRNSDAFGDAISRSTVPP